ncbi:hypothetical protein B0H12DRAFT_1153528 [Mycena haematopus]|nr:hypothetical protein B0H12DRAFT_1170535 [Mycena haematopus]KAJ7217563.1 hypothetical protein B0H12DRAFT_1153528 [Mycena haematopus]
MVDVASEIRIHDCLQLLSISLMYWDWLVTLDNEIGFMWKRARSASAYWFFAVRYSGILGNIPVTIFTFFNIPPQWCHAYHTGHQIVLVETQLIVSLVMLVRIHALYGRNLRLLAVLLVISLPLLAVIFWSVKGQQSTLVLGFPGCHSSVPNSSVGLAGAWLALFVFDSLCFGLTLFKTFSTWRQPGSEASYLPIHALVLRDGAAMTLANLSNIITFYPLLSGSLSTFASCVSVTLMARLMLNLHQTSDAGRGGAVSHLELELGTTLSPVEFRRACAGPWHFGYGAPQEAVVDVVDEHEDSHPRGTPHRLEGIDIEIQRPRRAR